MRADLVEAADVLQAGAFRSFFELKRSELVAEYARLVPRGDARREVLRLEGDIRHIDRMVGALERRFPDCREAQLPS
jgi:hypothetical protein